ncbi:MAG: 16S rRNA (guanine(527)-N(7))-methyltransferase RsmG [Anaerofustis sp.]
MKRQEYLENGLKKIGITVDQEKQEKMLNFMDLVLRKNQVMNLTAITDEAEFIELHIIDSLTILNYIPKQTASFIDIGTGAGFPGMIIKIAKPQLEVTLLDSLRKRIVFLSECENELNLNGIYYVHARAEEAGRSSAMRDTFDFAVARAVSSLPVLNEICLPLVKCSGMFLAMKGKDDPTEFMEGEIVAKKLGAEFQKKVSLRLPYSGAERNLLLYKKTTPTPKQYPRSMKKIKTVK